MIGRPTDHANLDLAQLHRDVIRGESNGKIIWQPRIACWISDKRFEGQPLPEPYEGMSQPEMFRHLQCSCRLYNPFNQCFQKIEDPRVTRTGKALSETDVETAIETPAGKQSIVTRKHATNRRLEHLKWEIASEEEMKVGIWRVENTTWRYDAQKYDAFMQESAASGCLRCTSRG